MPGKNQNFKFKLFDGNRALSVASYQCISLGDIIVVHELLNFVCSRSLHWNLYSSVTTCARVGNLITKCCSHHRHRNC
jgi:hypothetical protein